MIYLVLIAGIALYMWSMYGDLVTEKFRSPTANANIIENFPVIFEMLKHLPENDVYTSLIRGHTSVFLEHFQKSFVGNGSKRYETTAMQRARNKIERYIREIVFRLPNDLDKQLVIEKALEKLLRILQLMIDDVNNRWSTVR
jgi:hypothetical protein